ncbi:MAG TPA: hypothetical protein VLB47_11540 [Solirubrobacteraceae bacterium]|nr:hypothetical protein [Solirubrobacteraceae bacterium]
MSPLDQEVPPAGEEIHLPGPSLQPVLLAVGITVLLLGVTTSIVMVIAGGVLSLAVIVRWIADTRRAVGELPAGHGRH